MSKKSIAAIEAAGGTFADFGGPRELRGYAALPAGIIWEATGCHSIAVNYYSDRPAGWKSLMADVSTGTRPCDLPDCDVCSEDVPDC